MYSWGGIVGKETNLRVHPKDSSEVRKRYDETIHPHGTKLD